jgi:methionyl-tRNA synthetase
MTKPFYITTPIYYVNDVPHLGHAYTTIACDVLARWHRAMGKDVYFLTGTDEHGQKVQRSAEKAGIAPQAFVDKNAARFKDLLGAIGATNNDFIRTTEDRHKQGAQAFWKAIDQNGAIYKGGYSGWYATRDEAYYDEKELIQGPGGEKLAPTGAPVEWMEEESYFFKLSAFQDRLLKFYEENPDFVYPQSRFNEVKSFVKSGLQDLSISRTSFSWGIPVPGDEKHVMYVWLDALANYLTAIGYPNDSYKKYWPAIHMVGKDILRFHAVYWPAFLMAANIEPPKRIIAHGWWTINGEKMSKSIGNVIDPFKLIEQYGLDYVRYFLLREVPFGNDGDFSHESMITRCNAELANNLGNLAQRSLSMIVKNCDGNIPARDSAVTKAYGPKRGTVLADMQRYMTGADSPNFTLALEQLRLAGDEANAFIDTEAPWTLKKTDPARMAAVLAELAQTIGTITPLLAPFTPGAASIIAGNLGQTSLDFNGPQNLQNTALEAPKAAFPRLEAIQS